MPPKLAFVDLETTGASIIRDRVIEIGIVVVEEGKVVQTYQTLINPGISIPPEIEALTGISLKDVENAPSFYGIKKDLLDILEDSVFVAHNVRFDYGFLKSEFRRFETTFAPKHFCTVKLSRLLFPQYPNHNLDSIIERFDIKIKKRHRALDDAKAIWEFFKKAQKSFPKDFFQNALNTALKKPSLPTKLSEKVLDDLPESPGVYIFYGGSGAPLYVGKSINIRDRVLSHFSSSHSSNKELKIASQTESIEAIPTAGELGALLKETALIKKLQPLYNRMLRYSRKITALKNKVDQLGYQITQISEADWVSSDDLENLLNLFRSQKQAKDFLLGLCKEYSLCEKLLGLEKTKTSCFGYKLGRCRGACVSKENPLKYNLRFIEAFSKNKLKAWPFSGPILINEKGEEKTESFLVDKWCYLKNKSSDYIFDLDTYKILVRYLLSPKNLKNIKKVNTPNQTFTSKPKLDFLLLG